MLSVHGISQAGILEWVAISFSRVSSLIQGSNLHLLHRQAESLSLSHKGSLPIKMYLFRGMFSCFFGSIPLKLFSKSKVLHRNVSGQIEGCGSASVTKLQKLTLLCYRTWANGTGGCGGCHACDYTFWNSDPPRRFPEQPKQWTWKKWNNVVWLRLHEKGLKPSLEFIGFLFLSYFLFPSRDLLLCCKIIEVHWMFVDAKILKVSKAELQWKLRLIKHSKWDF